MGETRVRVTGVARARRVMHARLRERALGLIPPPARVRHPGPLLTMIRRASDTGLVDRSLLRPHLRRRPRHLEPRDDTQGARP